MNNRIYTLVPSSNYKRTRKLAKKQGKDLTVLDWGIRQLMQDIPLPENWKDHQLKGNFKNYRECHIGGAGDWLLVYEKRNKELILYLYGTGSHVDLLGL
ncbi:MAG: type II toxin-antitoxin system YafQ family toxin [Oscillospiraceae bacterium]|nr:type II toxin-antitoxin system YafQ family toxin [Oscillospiraceae bacterium]